MIELTKDKKHIIIKRDGREEPFNEEKLKKVINWATEGKEGCIKTYNWYIFT